jgi:hypothetical protein
MTRTQALKMMKRGGKRMHGLGGWTSNARGDSYGYFGSCFARVTQGNLGFRSGGYKWKTWCESASRGCNAEGESRTYEGAKASAGRKLQSCGVSLSGLKRNRRRRTVRAGHHSRRR